MSLPDSPNLDWLRKQGKRRLGDLRKTNPAARLADSIALSPLGNKHNRPKMKSFPVIIEDDVWIGFNATILKGVRVGRGAIVFPGAVVAEDVAPGVTVAGNPAKPVKEMP